MSYSVRREIPHMRGPGRAIAITVILLLLLLVAADVGLRLWAQAWMSNRVEQALGLPRDPQVTLGGFPFLPEFARGRFSTVEVRMEEFVAEGLRLDEVEVELAGVEFSQGDLLAGREGAVRIERGRVRVEVSEPSFNAFLRERGVPVAVTLIGPRVRASATIEVGGESATATAAGPLGLEDGALVFRPERVRVDGTFGIPPAALAFELPLPTLFQGMTYERVRVREAGVTVHASLDRAEVDLRIPAEARASRP